MVRFSAWKKQAASRGAQAESAGLEARLYGRQDACRYVSAIGQRARLREAEAIIREQGALLDMAQDAIIVCHGLEQLFHRVPGHPAGFGSAEPVIQCAA